MIPVANLLDRRDVDVGQFLYVEVNTDGRGIVAGVGRRGAQLGRAGVVEIDDDAWPGIDPGHKGSRGRA